MKSDDRDGEEGVDEPENASRFAQVFRGASFTTFEQWVHEARAAQGSSTHPRPWLLLVKEYKISERGVDTRDLD